MYCTNDVKARVAWLLHNRHCSNFNALSNEICEESVSQSDGHFPVTFCVHRIMSHESASARRKLILHPK